MRLELNLPALERLIGGDTELELHLRYQIIEQFCKERIKTLINDKTIQAMSAVWTQEIKAAVDEAIAALKAKKDEKIEAGLTTRNSSIWDLESAIKEAVRKEIKNQVESQIEESKRYYLREIQGQVHAAITKEVLKSVERGIQERLEAAKHII